MGVGWGGAGLPQDFLCHIMNFAFMCFYHNGVPS